MSTTKPGDLVGHDSDGRVRIDRVIPLPWVASMLAAVIVQAVTLWFQVQQTGDTVREVKSKLETLAGWQTIVQVREAEHRAEMQELRRRIETLEAAARK